MSSPRTDSRTNSVYVDASEFPADQADEPAATGNATTIPAGSSEHSLTTVQQAHSPTPEPSAQTPSAAGNDEEEEEEEEGEEEEVYESEDAEDDQEESSTPEERGRSQRGRTPNAASTEEDEEDDEEDMVMEVDPSTGLHRATSIPRVRTRSSSLANRLRRQHQRMTTSSGSSSRAGRLSSSTSSGPAAGQSSAKSSAPLVDEKAQTELRRKIMDIQRDPTISFADKASMIQVKHVSLFLRYVDKGEKKYQKRLKRNIDI